MMKVLERVMIKVVRASIRMMETIIVVMCKVRQAVSHLMYHVKEAALRGWMDGCMHGWIGKWMNGWIGK